MTDTANAFVPVMAKATVVQIQPVLSFLQNNPLHLPVPYNNGFQLNPDMFLRPAFVNNQPTPNSAITQSPPDNSGAWESIFGASIEELRTHYRDEPSTVAGSQYSIRDKTSWGETLNVLSLTYSHFMREDNDTRLARGTTAFQKYTYEVSKYGKPIASFIPEGTITSPIRTALQLAFDTIIAVAEFRDGLGDVLGDISHISKKAERCLSVQPHDEWVYSDALRLSWSLLRVIELVIAYMLGSSFKKALHSLQDPPKYQADLKNMVTDMKTCADDLLKTTLLTKINSIAKAVECPRQDRAQASSLGFACLAIDAVSQPPEYRAVTPVPEEVGSVSAGGGLVSFSEVVAAMSTAHGLLCDHKENIDFVSRTEIPERDVNRAFHLVQSEKLKAWLRAPRSAMILIVEDDAEEIRPVNGISFVATTIIKGVQSIPMHTCLFFFCGLNDNQSFTEEKVAFSMIQSLIAQVIENMPDGVEPQIPSSKIDMVALEKGSIIGFCDVFIEVLKCLPRGSVVMCVVDTVSIYEESSKMDGISFILALLVLLTLEDLPVAFKVMFTSPVRTLYFEQTFQDEKTVYLSSLLDGGDEAHEKEFLANLARD